MKTCLERLPVDEVEKINGDIILVDSCSNDNTWSTMEDFRNSCQCSVAIIRAEQPGLGLARNLGVAASSGRIIAFTDDDCYLEKNYLEEAVKIFSHLEIQYCGGRILLYDESDAMCSVNYQEEFEIIPSYSFVDAGKVQGANMVILRQVFDQIGGFDPSLGAGTKIRCEDIEFIGRASMSGYTGAHVPSLVVYHHHKRKSPSQELKKLIRKNDLARGAYYASMISKGFRNYLSSWIWHSMIKSLHKPWTYLYFRSIVREVSGAILYWRTHHLSRARE